jgi:hypothetical protein
MPIVHHRDRQQRRQPAVPNVRFSATRMLSRLAGREKYGFYVG